jgi:hypothetical protein
VVAVVVVVMVAAAAAAADAIAPNNCLIAIRLCLI